MIGWKRGPVWFGVAVLVALTAAGCGDDDPLDGTLDINPTTDTGEEDTPDVVDSETSDGDPDVADDGTDSGDDDDADVTVDTGTPDECETDDQCVDKVEPGQCEHAACIAGQCEVEADQDGVACDDGNACTVDDACSAASACAGKAVICDDENPCTTDSCDAETGECVTAPDDGIACDDDNICTENTVCGDGACGGGDFTCPCETDVDCAPKEDGNACNGTLVCLANVCVVDPDSLINCDPGVGTACLENVCVKATGTCELVPVKPGDPCDDGSVCTSDDACSNGYCAGEALDCDDDEPCTVDSCNALDGCQNAAEADAVICDDGDECTTADTCTGGVCKGDGVDCDDGNPCTDDSCTLEDGCFHAANTAPCDDGDACTTNDACLGNTCVPGAPLLCNDNNPCTDDACDAGTGCTTTNNTAPCSDKNLCTLNDQCKDGGCAGTSTLDCDDGNVCTDDSCDAVSGCDHLDNVAPCEDGNDCSEGDLCTEGLCVGGESTCGCEADADCAEFEDGDVCNGTLICDKNSFPFSCKVDLDTVVVCDTTDDTTCSKNTCDTGTGECAQTAQENGLVCDDADACTTTDTCENGDCTGEGAPECDDEDPCTTDGCDADGGCTHEPVDGGACDDGNLCTTFDECSAGACQGTQPTDCDDNTPCTVDGCGALTGCTHVNVGLPCSDNDACTTSDICFQGDCVGKGAPDCDDGSPCTADSCASAQGGCVNAPVDGDCDDGDECSTSDVCDAGVCAPGPALECDDNNVCTTDLCNPFVGCVSTPNEGACSDGNECTAGDHCTLGVCQFTGQTQCDDSNDCTTELCDPATGCVVTNNTKPCDDSNSCTTSDTCKDGACKGTVPANCNDNNPCTDDLCDPTDGGCKNLNNSQLCDDGDPCTTLDPCVDGECQTGQPLVCNDGNECTADTCTQADGCVFTNQDGACNDGDACTLGDVCESGACKAGPEGLACDDSNPCTLDSCDPLGGCSYAPSTADCDDGNPCTSGDVCNNLLCLGTGEADCDDGNVCTDDLCDVTSGCFYFNNDNPCDDGDECTIAGTCDEAVCIPSTAAPFCCTEDADCDDGSVCTDDSCKDSACVNTPTGSIFLEETFDSGAAAGFEFESDNEDVTWQLDTTKYVSPGHSLYWGNAQTHTYDYGEVNSTATLKSLSVPYGPAVLSFNVFIDVEDGADCDFDVLTIRVDGDQVAQECQATFGWKRVHVDVSAFAGRTVDVDFVMETGDDFQNAGQGVWLDNLVVTQGSCSGTTCAAHADCENHAGCSGGLCLAGKCSFAPAPPNQGYGENFDDMPADNANSSAQGWTFSSNNNNLFWNVATKQSSTGGQSMYAGNVKDGHYNHGAGVMKANLPKVRIPNSTESTLVFRLYMDVADQGCAKDVLRIKVGNKIMAQFCQSTGGQFIDIGVSLTEFFSQDIQPSFEFSAGGSSGTAEGVYVDDVAVLANLECGKPTENFDDNHAFNFAVESTNKDSFWHISTAKQFSGTRSLHCGSPATNKYDKGPVDTTATIAVKACDGGVLNFRVLQEVNNQSCADDVFTVSVGDDKLYEKCNNSGATFGQQSIPLGAYNGLTVPVTFRFKSSKGGTGFGTFVDHVISSCDDDE